MKKYVSLLTVSAMLAVAAPVTVSAASTVAPVVVQTSAVEGGRTLQVMVAQSEIKTDINPSNIAVATGGGLLGGLIGAAVDSARAKKAEELVGPVRTAMADFDADALAIDTAKASFGDMEWFKSNPDAAFGKDSSVAGKSALLDATSAKQIAFVEYSYDLSPTFDAVRVVAKIEVANKAIPASAKGKAEKRLSAKNLAYATRVTSVVLLKSAGTDKELNAPLWSADNGAVTRKALQLAFANLPSLTQRTMALTADDIKLLNDKKNKRTTSGGFTGRPQTPANERTTLLWDGSFINVEYMD
ncbi:MAG: hypothetical protein IPP23_07535 [Sphingomonadales bacterium]|nr:hypothetical protein [Sphingomonadales bacterium]